MYLPTYSWQSSVITIDATHRHPGLLVSTHWTQSARVRQTVTLCTTEDDELALSAKTLSVSNPSSHIMSIHWASQNHRIVPSSVSESVKNFCAALGAVLSWFFSEYEVGTKCNNDVANRCTRKFSMTSTRVIFFETAEILWSCWLIWQNRSRISIVVIQVIKSNFPTTATSKKAIQMIATTRNTFCGTRVSVPLLQK